MPGQPQLREAGWLYGEDPTLPIALVRLFEHHDESGRWRVWLNVNDPQEGEEPMQIVDHPDEASARAALERVYEIGREQGTWRIRQPDAY